jgi:hypothetical protein
MGIIGVQKEEDLTGGIQRPAQFLSLDFGAIENLEEHIEMQKDIQMQFVRFVFPEGLNKIDILEICRMIHEPENFDRAYNCMMLLLEGKPVQVYLRSLDGHEDILTQFHVVGHDMNLSLNPALEEYPYLINWMCEFMAGYWLKKYPMPTLPSFPKQASKENRKAKK